ncbi:hypothetical protein [Pseudoduganella buxea]|uniref:Uncharacterized protein n=1 Tax=Pseudoduganella buxea TaxID=1949069 RepID=A0A6I3T0U6_9BURK|nr:hypothetical protein [Pseudoduganella buxea]MTV54924.1 hypothetical protein [Pseudoduganella buxea]GGC23796.1 hypothetical protein GCM10011572_51630 [Pseudoduganella buxea]
MTAVKEMQINQSGAYKLAAEARRPKAASVGAISAGEVTPTQGRIRVTLAGKPISRDRRAAVLGPSSIDIPEFSLSRKGEPG